MESNNAEQTITGEATSNGVEREVQSNKNRKQRRFEAKLARSKKQLSRRTHADNIKAVVRQMKESKRVQNLVLEGKLDKYLG